MANRSIHVRVEGVEQLTQLHRALRGQADGKERIKQLRKELVKAAKPLIPAIRANIKSIPSRGQSRRRGRKPLRTRLSQSLTTQIRFRGPRAGIYVFMNPRKMPDGQKALPGYFETVPGKTRFRHPVFGNREVWVQQNPPQPGYFTRAIEGTERQVARNIERVLDETARSIEDR